MIFSQHKNIMWDLNIYPGSENIERTFTKIDIK